MKKGIKLHGFECTRTKYVKELNAEVMMFKHLKSGAELLYIAADDNEKAFNITFKTIPENDTGCPHIIEHCVINGSQHYPVKNIFWELSKGSMKTYLNANTMFDRTNYLFASTNDKDFMNLMDVYLDAVFFPNIYLQPEIFHQEGGHYELQNEEDELSFKGVVFNEMKGSLSTAETILYLQKIPKTQFPDSFYRYNFAGDPQYLPELTYEQFIAFHKKHYHPENSRIFLYGNLDLEHTLAIIDEKYLCQFNACGIEFPIPLQTPFKKQVEAEFDYPIAVDESPENRQYLVLSFTCGTMLDAETTSALGLLTSILINDTASPIKKLVQSLGLCDIFFGTFMDVMQQPTISFFFKNVLDNKSTTLQKAVMKELKRLVIEGIDKKQIEAIINSTEFALREAQGDGRPKGLMYSDIINKSWLYGGDPLVYIEYEALLKVMRKGLKTPYFEQLIDKYLLKNTHCSRIILNPVPGLIEKREKETATALQKMKKSLKKKELDALLKLNHNLLEWQNTPDTPENLALIPTINVADINPIAEVIPLETELYKEFTLLKHPLQTNGITYFSAYFDLAHADEDDLQWIALYSTLVGQIDTQNYTYTEQSNEIDIHTGGISMGLEIKNEFQDPENVVPKLHLHGKALTAQVQKLMELATEYALRPVFKDKERIKTLMKELKSGLEMSMSYNTHNIAIMRMFAPLSHYHHLTDLTEGMGFYDFICRLNSEFDTTFDSIIEKLEWISQTFFTQQNLIISLTATEEEIKKVFPLLNILVSQISNESFAPCERIFVPKDFNEGITAPFDIQYCVKGGNFFRKGFSYSGKLQVLDNLISSDYLMPTIREKGGAYSCFCNFNDAGYMYFCSYRDPNLRDTLDAFDECPKFMREFNCSKKDFEKYIIGTIADIDIPKSPEKKAIKSDHCYIVGFTQEDRQQVRNEILSTKLEDVHHYAELVEAVFSRNHICVCGNENIIKENADLFDKLTPLFRN